MVGAGRPLTGVRVLEVGIWHAGPGAASILGDLGADVIKVETLSGDPERYFSAFNAMTDTTAHDTDDWTVMFELSNRNKRSISVDLSSSRGRELFDSLLSSADVFITNLRAPTVVKLGLDYATLARLNPRLVHVNVTGFGSRGSKADAGAFDTLGQSVSGLMFLAGTDEPAPLNTMVCDQLTAIVASHAAIAALLSRELHGHGQDVHVSLYGAATWLTTANLAFTSVRDAEIDLTWTRRSNCTLQSTFRCADDEWIIGANVPEQPHWQRFCEAIDRPDLAQDPQLATQEQRDGQRAHILGQVDPVLAARSRGQWLQQFSDAGLMFAPVNRFQDVLADPQAQENEFVTAVQHRELGRVVLPGFPARFGQAVAGPGSPAPRFGEHTVEIAREAGLSADEVDALVADGVLKTASAR